jgi:uncharacterized protein YceH (UPF0502 family)
MIEKLDQTEIRIIGSLIEKEIATPEYYPLTLNSLINACNQKSSRDPVVNYDETIVENAVNVLREKRLVRRVTGDDMRVPKYRQTFTEELNLLPDETAVMCVLMLRGPQTPGEIKNRTGRLYNFANLNSVNDTIEKLSRREFPLVKKLPRQAGMKEARYAHLLSGEEILDVSEVLSVESKNETADRIQSLEEELKNIHRELNLLKEQFQKFRKQFE